MTLPENGGTRGYDVFELEGRLFAVLVAHETSFLALPLDHARIHQLTETNFFENITSEYSGTVDLDEAVEFRTSPPGRSDGNSR